MLEDRREAIARQPGRCAVCKQQIRSGETIATAPPLKWCHAPCAIRYLALRAENEEAR